VITERASADSRRTTKRSPPGVWAEGSARRICPWLPVSRPSLCCGGLAGKVEAAHPAPWRPATRES